jgi:hypothetical protein
MQGFPGHYRLWKPVLRSGLERPGGALFEPAGEFNRRDEDASPFVNDTFLHPGCGIEYEAWHRPSINLRALVRVFAQVPEATFVQIDRRGSAGARVAVDLLWKRGENG